MVSLRAACDFIIYAGQVAFFGAVLFVVVAKLLILGFRYAAVATAVPRGTMTDPLATAEYLRRQAAGGQSSSPINITGDPNG